MKYAKLMKRENKGRMRRLVTSAKANGKIKLPEV